MFELTKFLKDWFTVVDSNEKKLNNAGEFEKDFPDILKNVKEITMILKGDEAELS